MLFKNSTANISIFSLPGDLFLEISPYNLFFRFSQVARLFSIQLLERKLLLYTLLCFYSENRSCVEERTEFDAIEHDVVNSGTFKLSYKIGPSRIRKRIVRASESYSGITNRSQTV